MIMHTLRFTIGRPRIGRALGFVVLALAGWMPGYAQDDARDAALEQAAPWLAAGDSAYARFDNLGAVEAYERAGDLAPDAFAVVTRLARTHNEYGMDRQAEGDDEAAEAQFITSVAYADRLERLFPEQAETYFYLTVTNGNLALFRGGREKVRIGRKVEVYCLKGIALDSTYAKNFVALGIFRREVAKLSWFERLAARALFGGIPQGSFEEAEQLLSRAAELDPTLPMAQYELALVFEAQGRRDEAADRLRRSIRLPARNTGDLRNRVRARRLLDAWGLPETDE
jgi:tetratricopeptide (TPR) repeat protein